MKKIKLKDFEVKSFVTDLKSGWMDTVKGGASGNPSCEDPGFPTQSCTCNGTGTGNTNNTQVPACPVSYPQIYCDGDPYETPLCTN